MAVNCIVVIQQFATKFWWYNFVKHWAIQNRGRMLAAYLNFDSFANSGYDLILLTHNIRAFFKTLFLILCHCDTSLVKSMHMYVLQSEQCMLFSNLNKTQLQLTNTIHYILSLGIAPSVTISLDQRQAECRVYQLGFNIA